MSNAPSSPLRTAVDVDLAGAVANVVDALQESTAARLEHVEDRMLAKASAAGAVAMYWGLAIAAAAVAWAGANLTLALWVSAAVGTIAAALLTTLIHAVAALALLWRARLYRKQP